MVSITIPRSMRLTEREWDALFAAYNQAAERELTHDADRLLSRDKELRAPEDDDSCLNGTCVEEREYINAGYVNTPPTPLREFKGVSPSDEASTALLSHHNQVTTHMLLVR